MQQQQHRMDQHDESHTKNHMRKSASEKTNAKVNEVISTKRINSVPQNNTEPLDENTMALLSDYKRKIQESEAELEKRKESESNLFDTLVMQTKQLEQNKILLEESRLEISSLEEKLKTLQLGSNQTNNIKGLEGMKVIEQELPKKKLNETQDEPSMKVKNLVEELDLLKSELISATKAEENSKKAMDDLAFALKEVATEANQVKAKLTLSQVELEHTKGDAERWKTMLENTEEKYKELLDVTRKEADRFKNTAERLRLEAEESLLAWNEKETEFVTCIKRADEERLLAQQETTRLLDLLKEAENKTKVSKEENQKLRDILKQALNEANVAKEAAEIAKAENARLQDSLSLLVHENETLKIHEAASFENIIELKRMLSESSTKEFKNEDIEKSTTKEDKESGKKAKAHNSGDHHKEHRESKSLSKTFSLNLKDMITTHKQQHKVGNELEVNKDIREDDTLRGSIFDEVDSSDSESHHDVDMGIPDDFEHYDESHFDESEGDRNNRKSKALLKRFGDLIRRKNTNHHFHRKELSHEEHLQT
ncbi:uncharacterized protein [Cicer arietinum]|uniref:WEB family protein At4g27595, chloroplastic n=1 Tax=Cicer arietinum TaxID=3827 RepID=A0A1S2YBJ7_CICAR|nr:WEB family protein At4g27595, chloroplastic [Cicer arietinum]XP_004502405.1 WEB family protein At4g27595, chloroplastic [Cicer arietinum]